jgi:propanol-preferring alcohol dehydrogenase
LDETEDADGAEDEGRAVHEFGKQVVVEEIDIPELPEGQVLVKVVASGVCHTDLHAAEGDWPV